MQSRFIMVGCLIFFYCLVSVASLTIHPPVWPDEAIFAEMATNLRTEGKLVTHVWGDTIPHIQTRALFYPPLLPLLIAGNQSLFGISITYQRAMASLAGLAILLLLIRGSSLLPATFFVTNVAAMRFTRLSRPEVFIVVFGLLALFMIEAGISTTPHKRKVLFAGGLLLGTTVLFHHMGIIFVVAVLFGLLLHLHKKRVKAIDLTAIAGGFLLTTWHWILTLITQWDIFSLHTKLGYAGKALTSPWILYDLQSSSLGVFVLTIILVILSCYTLYIFVKEKINATFAAMTLVCAWTFSFLGRSEMYYFYVVISMLYALTFLPIHRLIRQRRMFMFLSGAMLLIQVAHTMQFTSTVISKQYNYHTFAKEVAAAIPEDSTVLLSTIPDPYFEIINKRGITVFEFPALATSIDRYHKLLGDTEYVVFNGDYASHLFGPFLGKYAEKNAVSHVEIQRGNYRTTVYKLHPKDKRVKDY